MKLRDTLKNIGNAQIEFVTMRPPGSKFAILDRRVVITGPPELAELSRTGDPALLDELISLLQDKATAWPAAVLLAAMTRRDEKTVEGFAPEPDQWWETFGPIAFEQWSRWLQENRDKLVWDSENQMFAQKE